MQRPRWATGAALPGGCGGAKGGPPAPGVQFTGEHRQFRGVHGVPGSRYPHVPETGTAAGSPWRESAAVVRGAAKTGQ
ncbi:hypothetical protein GCM10017567_05310 [Amycolatopsis bullii]|uniref:Uncharacterized protein n=1 Tax=Amycolatopsis bullii TaxID=941987 RepID=A0ABQ3JZY5_9PSEU|nr:hypothetical protein GCM10017567_05310 [Amycolatopsis bullii]